MDHHLSVSVMTHPSCSQEEQPHIQRAVAVRVRRAERSYSIFKVRSGDLVQGKEQGLCFAGVAMKRYPTPKVRKTQVRW